MTEHELTGSASFKPGSLGGSWGRAAGVRDN